MLHNNLLLGSRWTLIFLLVATFLLILSDNGCCHSLVYQYCCKYEKTKGSGKMFSMRRLTTLVFALCFCVTTINAFAPPSHQQGVVKTTTTTTTTVTKVQKSTTTALNAADVPDLATVALVAGQENYGLAIVLLGESIWSFSGAPSIDHGLKTLVPAGVAAAILAIVSGPMITSGDANSVGTGLWIATAVSVAMGGVYLARCLAPFSPTPKEIPALGVVVAVAGFFSFSQNLIVDGFVTLPSIPLPTLPTIELPF